MTSKNNLKKPSPQPAAIPVPPEAAQMTPKQILLLMRALGVGKENYQPPNQATPWSTAEFLEACTRDDVYRRVGKLPPERSTVDGWFAASGPLPDERRPVWHFFFHVFFSFEHRAFGTLAWKEAYFQSVTRAKTRAALQAGPVVRLPLPAAPAVYSLTQKDTP